jgi:hypothetical protein
MLLALVPLLQPIVREIPITKQHASVGKVFIEVSLMTGRLLVTGLVTLTTASYFASLNVA